MKYDLYDLLYEEFGAIHTIDEYGHETGFEVGRTKLDALRIPFLWLSHSGGVQKIKDMDTSHLFNTVRMIHNNTVERAYRVLCPDTNGYRAYPEIKTWDPEYTEKALSDMTDELLDERWGHLSRSQERQLRIIIENQAYLHGV